MTQSIDISHIKSLIVVGGTSGAGKSKALDAISDFGYFNIENVPVPVLGSFLEYTKINPNRFQRLVILPDISSTANVEELLSVVETLVPKSKVHLIYIDCSNEVIIRRYSETRRPHPCFDAVRDKTLEDAIIRERTRLAAFRDRANLLLDTSVWNIHELKRALVTFSESIAFSTDQIFRINFLSFGFKYGLPADCDIVMDARFLPNPYFIEHLRDKDGTDAEVSDFVLSSDDCKEFLSKYIELLRFSLPLYINAGKQYLNIGIGCTGGKHRSVAIAEALSKKFNASSFLVSAKHRDREK